MLHFILYPLFWICWWRPHRYEHVPEVVMRGIDPLFVYKPTYLCSRCGQFMVATTDNQRV